MFRLSCPKNVRVYCYTEKVILIKKTINNICFDAPSIPKALQYKGFRDVRLSRHSKLQAGSCDSTKRKWLGFGFFKPISEPFLLVGEVPKPPFSRYAFPEIK